MEDQPNAEYSGGAGCLTRIYRMCAGRAVLAMLVVWLILNLTEFPCLQDAGGLLALASRVAVQESGSEGKVS